MDWCSFGANFGELRALSETPQNVAITVLLDENGVLNENLNKSVLFFVVEAFDKLMTGDCQICGKKNLSNQGI